MCVFKINGNGDRKSGFLCVFASVSWIRRRQSIKWYTVWLIWSFAILLFVIFRLVFFGLLEDNKIVWNAIFLEHVRQSVLVFVMFPVCFLFFVSPHRHTTSSHILKTPCYSKNAVRIRFFFLRSFFDVRYFIYEQWNSEDIEPKKKSSFLRIIVSCGVSQNFIKHQAYGRHWMLSAKEWRWNVLVCIFVANGV